jgi:hypothetical protein
MGGIKKINHTGRNEGMQKSAALPLKEGLLNPNGEH